MGAITPMRTERQRRRREVCKLVRQAILFVLCSIVLALGVYGGMLAVLVYLKAVLE